MKISDEAKKLVEKIVSRVHYKRPTACSWDVSAYNDAQSALDAARNCALEDAAAMTSNSPDGWNAERHAEAIRAMKVPS